jgi:hypothetical protein
MLTLLKIFLFFVILVFVGGLIGKYLLKRFFKNMQQNMYNQTGREEKKKEGKVTIEYNNKKNRNKRYRNDQGDYIDYEEIDE